MKKQFILFVALSCLWMRGDARSKYVTDEEDNPYEFGFTIDGQQHRHEKKDANGIIQGEFGFITADGIYHVTVYATDQNGNFRILSMRNVRVSGPLDEPNASLPDTSQFSKGQPAAPNPLSINTTPAPVQTVQPVTQSNRFTTQSTIKPACAGCGYVTHATPLNKPENNLPFQTQAGYNPKPQDVIIGDKRPNVQQQSLGQSGVQHGVQHGVQQGVTSGSGLGIPTSTKAPFVSKPIGGKPQTGSGFHSVGQFNPPGNSPNYPNQGIQASLTTSQNLGNQPQLSPGLGPNTGHNPSYPNHGNQDLVVAPIPTYDNGLQNQQFSGAGPNAVGQFNRPGNNVYPNQGNKEPSVNPQTQDLNLHKAQTDIPQTSQTPVDSQKTLIDRKSIEGQHLHYKPILGQIPTGNSNQGTPTIKNYPLLQNPLETTTKSLLSYQQSVTIQPGTYQNQEQYIQHGSIPKQNSEIFPQSNSHISPNSPDSEKHQNYQNIPISDNQEQLNQNRQDAQNLGQSLNLFLSDPIKSQVGSQSTILKQTPEVFTETSSYTSPKSFFSNKTTTSQNIPISNDQEQLNQNRPSYKQQDAPSLEQVSNPLSSKPVNPQVGPHGTLSPQSVPNLLHRPDGQINETPHQYQPIPTYVVPEQPQIYQNFEQSPEQRQHVVQPVSNPTVTPNQHLVITVNSDAPQSKPQTPQNNIPQHQNNFNTELVTRPPTQSRQQTPQEQRTESPQNKQQDTGSVAPFTSEIQKPQISGNHHQPNQQQDPLLNPLSISSPNHLSSLAPQSGITISNGVINVPNNPPIPIQDKYPGMVDGLPAGIKEGDITDLLYRFNYTVGFHGHYEKGYKNGAKVGGYFVNDRDGVSRIVTYVADENGYRPKVKFIRLDLNSDLVPKEGTEKTFGLKNFEFVWYPLN